MTTVHELVSWFESGVAQGASHMIVVCDTFDWEDYPVYVSSQQDVREEATKYDGKNMQKLMEVYDLKLNQAMQMAERRAFHF